jgi:hypothetical protein
MLVVRRLKILFIPDFFTKILPDFSRKTAIFIGVPDHEHPSLENVFGKEYNFYCIFAAKEQL